MSGEELKRCRACKELKPPSDFNKNNRNMRDGLQANCKPCNKGKDQRRKRKVKSRAWRLRSTFDISPWEWSMMLKSQDGTCNICDEPEKKVTSAGKPQRMAVDHDHYQCEAHAPNVGCPECIRGLLCERCNKRQARLEYAQQALIRMGLGYRFKEFVQNYDDWWVMTYHDRIMAHLVSRPLRGSPDLLR